MKNKESKKLIVLLFAVCILLVTFFNKGIGDLTGEALNTLGVLIFTLILLVFDVFPLTITCLITPVMLVIFKCTDISNMFYGYSNHILFFTMASFGISMSLSKTTICQRFLINLLSKGDNSSRKIMLYIMLCNLFLSSIISDVAAILIFIPVVDEVLHLYANEKERIQAKRTYFMCVLLSSMIGGMMTPAGSSINLITLNALEEYANKHVSFVQWMSIGIPMGIIILLIAFFVLLKVYPPAELSQRDIEKFICSFSFGKYSREEKYTATVIICAILLWIASSWIPSIHITVVAISALAVLFLPKYGVITWKEYNEGMNWGTFFIAGTMITLAKCVVDSGLSDFILSFIVLDNITLPLPIMAGIISAVTFAVMIFIPSAPASISMLGPFVVDFALRSGYNPCLLVMACGMSVTNCFLLPLDTPAVVIYSQKAFKMHELPRVTFWVQLCIIIMIAILVPSIGRLVRIG